MPKKDENTAEIGRLKWLREIRDDGVRERERETERQKVRMEKEKGGILEKWNW